MADKKGNRFNGIMKFAGKVQNNLVISSITEGMMSTMGVLMGSAMINILINLPIEPWIVFLNKIGLVGPLNQVVQIANCVAIFMTFGIGRKISEKLGADNPIDGGIISILCFLIITPIVLETDTYYFNLAMLGSQAVMTAMICGCCAGALFAKLSKTKFKIKMPDSVPVFVSQSFENLPSFVVTIIPFIIIRALFNGTSYGCFTSFINTTIQAPLTMVGNSLGGHIVIILACCLMWWLGLHGTMIIMPALYLLTYAPLAENISALATGQPAPNLLSFMTILSCLQLVGGPGCLFGLVIDMAFFTKSERYKSQGKLQLIPGLFNVIEPTVYGLPVVLNFTLLIPFVFLPVLVYVLMYLGLKMSLFTTPITLASTYLPGPIMGFLASGGIGFGIFIVLMCLLSCVVYYPFVKIMDAQELKLEQELAKK